MVVFEAGTGRRLRALPGHPALSAHAFSPDGLRLAAAGEEVVLFGAGEAGEATAQEWGETLGTISYDLVTGIGPRIPRTYA